VRSIHTGCNVVRRCANALPVVASLLALAQFCFAQSFTSSITGTVTDPTAATVQGATIELKDMATDDVRQATSDSNGSYQFSNLSPGTYQITATAAGFKSFEQRNLILQANTGSRVNISLELGNTQQKVEVTGSAVLLDTETANSSSTLDSQLVSNLPNPNRNPLNFVFAVAGTTQGPSGMTQPNSTFDQNASMFGLNGGRTGEASILIDGAPSTAVDWGGLIVSPLQDSVQEQQIIENTYDAQYERAGMGIVTLITKGGTNQFHGEVYDYLQNDALNANSWANNKFDQPKGGFKRNQFGGNIGGPILKRANLFFFGAYEGLRQPQTVSSGLQTVPTAAERAGNFAGALNSDGTPDLIYNPFTSVPLPDGTYTRQQFPGNVIPQNLINPVGAKMLSLYPSPNRPGDGPNQINNFIAQGAANSANDKMDARVDWEQSSVHRLFVRWSDRFRQTNTNPCFFCTGGDSGINESDNGFQVVVNDTITPSPTWVINTFASYSRWREGHLAQTLGTADASTIGLSPDLFQAPILPGINAENFSGLGVTFGGGFQTYIRYSNTVGMNITKVLSKHTLKFGGNFDDQRINSIDEPNGVDTGSPAFNFGTALTSCDPNPAGGPCIASSFGSSVSGNAIASMLLGTASGGGTSINIAPAMGLHTFGGYIQDQWRVSPRLTLNVGVRYENQRPATERINRIEFFNTTVPNPISSAIGFPVRGGFEYAGVNGNDRYAWPPNNKDFAPRAGIAFKITDRLVARAGAGIFFLPPSAMLTFDNPGQFFGFSSSTPYNATSQNGYIPLNLVNNPFPSGISQPTGSSQGLLTLVGNGLGQIWPKAPHPTPYSEQWSFDLQYQLSPHSVFSIGYTGNKGRKLLYGNPDINANQLPDQFLSLQSQLDQEVPNPFFGVLDPSTSLGSSPTIKYNQLLRPFPEFTNLQWARSLPGARSSYNALNVKYNHSFSAGLSVLMTYRWSKALDNGPEDFIGWGTGTQWRDSNNTMLDYNISTHDIPQSFATALVYDLPYGRGKHWGNTAPGIVKEVLGNWQLSSIVRLSSGLPIAGAVYWNPNNPLGNYGFPGPQIANLVGNPIPSNQGPDNWINSGAYAAPPTPWTIGNAPQRMTQLRERAARNVDLSIAKNFGGERYQAWLRGEFLNAFNYAQYNGFCTDISQNNCGPFGVAQGTENSPRMIQVSLKLVF
jgi:hypothetical protein